MPFVSSAYLDHLSLDELAQLCRTHINIGYHPETHDNLFVADSDRYAGMYLLGVQGSGKSSLLQNLIAADIAAGRAAIMLDPHGDSITACLAQLPDYAVPNAYLLDMEDESYPFGVSLFSHGKLDSDVALTQAINRLMHIFEVLWPDVLSQQHLPRYVRAAAITFLANPGATLVDMYHFLTDSSIRYAMLQQVTDPTVRQFWQTQYEQLSEAERTRRVQPLIGRLEALFMGRSLVRNIVGQRRTTIDFRKAIEQKQLLFIKLPIKTVKQDAQLIGTILLAQIHAAIFSFADTPADKRPGVSLYVDELSHFSTPDINELFSESRKFGCRLTIAHQYRSQLPAYLRDSTMSARTKICFQLTPEDGREMAHLFPSSETTIQPEDIEPHPVHHLLTYTPDNSIIQTFTEAYLRPLQGHKRGNRVEINEFRYDWIESKRLPNLRIPEPTPYLDALLYQVMQTGDPFLPIPPEAVKGFANCGCGFYHESIGLSANDWRLSDKICFPPALVAATAGGGLRWTRRPEDGGEQLFHFIFYLRMVMRQLAAEPIGKKSTTSTADVAKMLTSLPKRAAFVHAADTVGVIYTHDTPPALPDGALYERIRDILAHTRQTYCHPRAEVERLFLQSTGNPGRNQNSNTAPAQTINQWNEVE